MKRIYLDNAATTPLDPEVLEAMLPYLKEHFGNPSSIYSYGREARLAVENARKKVASILQANPGEIFFTSGGTESDNMAIFSAVHDLGCRHIITSPIEHHAVLHTVEFLDKKDIVTVSYVKLFSDGHVDLEDLEKQLAGRKERCLVSLMHANNEIGNLLDIYEAGEICKKYNAIFHSDTVQTVGHYKLNLRSKPLHFATASAHKFHGPKGVGMLYINDKIKVNPFIHGGGQERNMRAGTENVSGIVGFAKALELADTHLEKDSAYIRSLKKYMIEQLRAHLPDVQFNGDYEGNSLYTVLNVSFPKTEKSEMILFNLDMEGICASGGSACSSGADVGSHVIRSINNNPNRVPVRFSFSKMNTREEIDVVVQKLKKLI
ncbi:MAG: cysteine desulfurase [Chitinophagaceae bacterium]|nr:cysteine desulfurase [Chitinophagaceae bacterium]